MKNKVLVVVFAVLLIGAAGLVFIGTRESSQGQGDRTSTAAPAVAPHSDSSHSHTARVPAYQSVSQIDTLSPTLAPAGFAGKTRQAYQVAKEIPKTLAQLPCYCECDQAYGHKSLQTCFVDDHASHCTVCVDEALMAYKLQKEDKLSPEQVREKIIEEYSAPPGTR
ncbi:MAG TPA: CYCXC family (seleno)protein [Pyrinomonadaceae bacterium]|nr:CYCXC family (seleno)protein [Pyrinomonadaceae bacterium]